MRPIPSSALPAQLVMAEQTRLHEGPVDVEFDGRALEGGEVWLHDGLFVLRTPEDLRFRYRQGEGVTLDRSHAADSSAAQLWFNGSVYSAVASMNGLMPVHASAVACDGAVHAFTGETGAGKSTLVTALGGHGLPMFCDDTLVLDLSDPDRIVCLPGHKRLKLTPEALALTGAARQEKVADAIDKFYAAPPAGDVGEPLPLATLTFLEEGGEAAIAPIQGAERLVRLQDDHYTAYLYHLARGFDRQAHFAHLARLARQIAMARFVRPRDTARFADGVALVAGYVKGHAARSRDFGQPD